MEVKTELRADFKNVLKRYAQFRSASKNVLRHCAELRAGF